MASGQPPQNKSGNPKSVRYLVQSRLGDNIESAFVNVLEPYDKAPFIKGVRPLQVEGAADPNAVVALAVDLADGRTDVIVSCEQPQPIKVEGGIELNGAYGLVRFQEGQVKTMRLVRGTLLAAGGLSITAKVAAYAGTVQAVDVSDPADNRGDPRPGSAPRARRWSARPSTSRTRCRRIPATRSRPSRAASSRRARPASSSTSRSRTTSLPGTGTS